MVKRSLQASPAGIQQAKRAFALKGWTQENLAGEVNLKTRQPIWRFFTGQPVDRQIFMQICVILNLDWRDIAENPPAEFPEPGEVIETVPVTTAPTEINTLVQQVRSQYRSTIQNQCGILQLLDINRPVSIDDIYVDVNILEEFVSQQWLEIGNLQNLNPTEFDRVGLGAIEQPQIPGIEAVETHSKLRVLGKPGVGKTTFLKHLAIQCNRGEFAAQQFPVFITLRDFAEESRDSSSVSLLIYIRQAWLIARVTNPSVLKTLLQQGRYIEEYLQTLPDAMLEPEELQLDTEVMLKAIEAQHDILIERARGIFSFSYLAFQEYFTARKIVASHNLRSLEQALERLVSHITDRHWRGVFLLTVAMLRSADSLVQVMKQEIDAQPSPTAAHFTLASTLDQGIVLDAAFENLLLEFAAKRSHDFAYVNACSEALNNILVMVLDAGFYKSLQQLKNQLPPPNQSQERLQNWWEQNCVAWVEQVKATIARYRNIQHPWQFTPEQQQVLQRYYDANQLLIDCLNSNCEVTAATWQEIEATLLLPQKALEAREWQGD